MVNLDDRINLAQLHDAPPELMEHYSDVPELQEYDQHGNPLDPRPLFAHSDLPATLGIERVHEDYFDWNQEFIYCVYLHHYDALSAKYLHKLSPKVLDAVRKRQCKLILDNTLEGDAVYDFYTQLHLSAIRLELPLNQIYYLSNNMETESELWRWTHDNKTILKDAGGSIVDESLNLNVLSYLYNVHDIKRLISTGDLPERVDIDREIKYKKANLDNIKHFLKVNRTGRYERDLFMLYLNKHDMFKNFSISFPNMHGLNGLPEFIFPEIRDKQNLYSLAEKLPFDIDITDTYNHGKPGSGKWRFNADLPFQPVHYRNTFMSVVMCAFPMVRHACHLHSSTYNPMWCGHPVIQFGPYRHLHRLRKKGFQTFGKWWDESYDDIWDGWKRLEKIFEIVTELNKKTPQEMLDMYIDMQHVLRHNINLMDNYDASTVLKKFIFNEH